MRQGYEKTLCRLGTRTLLAIACSVGLLSGCGANVSSSRPTIFWPPPPERPLLKFIDTYASSDIFAQSTLSSFSNWFSGNKTIALRHPYGIVSDHSGKVYVSDLHLQALIVFDFVAQRSTIVETVEKLPSPHGLAIDQAGNIYVADSLKQQVVVLKPNGNFVRAIGNKTILQRPINVAVHDRAGRLYVSDARNHRVAVFSLTGEHLFNFGQLGAGKGEMAMPHGVAIGPGGSVYVADMLNARVQVFGQDGRYLRQIGNAELPGAQLEFPRDIAFASDGSLHIVDIKRGQLITCGPDGSLRLITGDKKPSAHILGLSSPTTINIDRNDRLFIADQGNRRFSVWQYMRTDRAQEELARR